MSRTRCIPVVVALMATSTCAGDLPTTVDPPSECKSPLPISTTSLAPVEYLIQLNQRLASEGTSYAVAELEYLSTAGAAGAQHYSARVPEPAMRLPIGWVPGDPRRNADGRSIAYLNYSPLMIAEGTDGPFHAESAINAAMHASNASQCSPVHLVERPSTGVLPSAIVPGGDPFAADVVSLGFLSGAFFDLVLGAGAGSSVLRATFTFVFVEVDDFGRRSPTDSNGDGRLDKALQETWYNSNFIWSADGRPGFSIGTAARIEVGAISFAGQ